MQQYLDNCIVIEVSLDLRVLYAFEFTGHRTKRIKRYIE